ncbi:MAG: hypothetical protein L6U99_09410 [Clostridium sp.]|nr:MAG: hypothetical protein L6U99_09410 [Clostridium sp.]
MDCLIPYMDFLDSIICSAISASSVTTVSALSQVKNALSAFGAGIAGGGAIIVARHYGAGRIEEAKKNSAVLFFNYISCFFNYYVNTCTTFKSYY